MTYTLKDVEVDWRYRDITEVKRQDVTPLWVIGSYDGPMSGMVEYQGRMHYAKCVEMDAHPARRYFLAALTDEQISYEVTRNNIWEQCYGTHCRCDRLGRRDHSGYRPNLDTTPYHVKYGKDVRQYSDNPVVGWFEAWGISQQDMDEECDEG